MNVSGNTANSTPWAATRPIASQTRSTVPLPPARSGEIWTAAALIRFMGLEGEQQAYRYWLGMKRILCILLRNKWKTNAHIIAQPESDLVKNVLVIQIQTVRMVEIAQQLGVASSTVSRALRGDPRIGAQMRRRVEDVAEKMGYRPNPLVSALMANRRRRGGVGEVDVIALVTNYGGRESWRSKEVCQWEFEGIVARAAALGFRVEIFPLSEYHGDATRLAPTLRARGIRGVLLGFSREESLQVPLPAEGFAVAGLSAYFRWAAVDRANFHGFYNVQLALEQMWRLGYRRPGLVVPGLNNQISNNPCSRAFLGWQARFS